MTDEIELVSDGDGIAVIGEPGAVDRFLVAEGLASRAFDLNRMGGVTRAAAAGAETASVIAANSGRWVQVTKESADFMSKFDLMKGSADGLSRAIAMSDGKTAHIVEFVQSGASMLTNPAILTGVAGIMSQIAMQQAMDEIGEYLETIDAKVDDVLRAQKDATVADMLGVDFVIEEAMTIRNQVGHVSEVTWSKVQGTTLTIARTQAYALRQLDALAEKIEKESSVDKVSAMTKEIQTKVRDGLAILAHCFKLQDAIAILELDRVFETAPQELDKHRTALRAARSNRKDLIAKSTGHLMARIDAAAPSSNMTVLLNPFAARAVVKSSNDVAVSLIDFHEHLGIEASRQALEATAWIDAAAGVRSDLVGNVVDAAETAGRVGNEAFVQVRSFTDKLALKVTDGARKRRESDAPGAESGERR